MQKRFIQIIGLLKKIFLFLVLLLPLLWMTEVFAEEREVHFAIGEWAPYTGERLPGSGVASEIVSASCAAVGLKAKFSFYPWKRAELNVLKANYFGTFPYKETATRSADFIFSNPLLSNSFGILINIENPLLKTFEYNGVEDLRGFRVGIVAGTEALKSQLVDSGVEVQEVATPQQNFGKLQTGRIDFYIDDKAVLSHILNTQISLKRRSFFRFTERAFGEKNEWKIMVSKKYPGNQFLLDQINHGLESIKASGEYNLILERQGLSIE